MKKYGQYGEAQGSQSATLLLAVVNGSEEYSEEYSSEKQSKPRAQQTQKVTDDIEIYLVNFSG